MGDDGDDGGDDGKHPLDGPSPPPSTRGGQMRKPLVGGVTVELNAGFGAADLPVFHSCGISVLIFKKICNQLIFLHSLIKQEYASLAKSVVDVLNEEIESFFSSMLSRSSHTWRYL